MAETHWHRSLEEELNIPPNALLEIPLSVASAYQSFLCLSSSDGLKTSIPINLSSSIRWKEQPSEPHAKPRCLIVGRQASTVDIRIDHKSISRKHAALFYQLDCGTTGQYNLCLLPTVSKHGTFVNSQKISDGSLHTLHDGDHIQFGNCMQYQFQVAITGQQRVQDTSSNESQESADMQQTNEVPQADTSQAAKTDDKGCNEKKDAFDGLTGRARREAEIAAMMASLNETPAYSKYRPEESDMNGTTEGRHTVAGTTSKDTITQTQLPQHQLLLPVTHEVEFAQAHTKSITAMAMDPAGSRLITGSNDYTCQMYDFGGMDASHKPFQEVRVSSTVDYMDGGQFPISSISYSPSGDKFVIATTSACPKVYDRDGHEM